MRSWEFKTRGFTASLRPKKGMKKGTIWRIIPFSKWLVTMVIVSPLNGGNFPFQMGVLWLINRGDPNHLLNGMILQVGCPAGSDRNYFVSWVVSPT